ncbi:MAG: SRPBCC domain-containing protein [Euryarchaeota archaeon]|nr:SRPBCC domain-containing protein [Euryarchaeota archaeon]
MAQRTAAATPSTLSLPSDREIQIDRAFNAPRPLVWRAWTEPKLLPKWLGPARFKMTKSEMDVRKGGTYRWEWNVPPSGLVIRGNFVEVDAPRRMVTEEYMEPYPEPSHNTITFTEKDGRTTVSVLIRVKTKEGRDAMLETGMKQGMDEGYGRLDGLLTELR